MSSVEMALRESNNLIDVFFRKIQIPVKLKNCRKQKSRKDPIKQSEFNGKR